MNTPTHAVTNGWTWQGASLTHESYQVSVSRSQFSKCYGRGKFLCFLFYVFLFSESTTVIGWSLDTKLAGLLWIGCCGSVRRKLLLNPASHAFGEALGTMQTCLCICVFQFILLINCSVREEVVERLRLRDTPIRYD